MLFHEFRSSEGVRAIGTDATSCWRMSIQFRMLDGIYYSHEGLQSVEQLGVKFETWTVTLNGNVAVSGWDFL